MSGRDFTWAKVSSSTSRSPEYEGWWLGAFNGKLYPYTAGAKVLAVHPVTLEVRYMQRGPEGSTDRIDILQTEHGLVTLPECRDYAESLFLLGV
jgi:hypothetical protein